MMRGHPVDAPVPAGIRPGTAPLQRPDGEQADALGDAVGRSANRPGDMRPVAVAIVRVLSVTDRIEADEGAAAELRVRPADAGVDDVRVHAGARSRVRIGGIQRQVALTDAIESPRRIALRDERLDHRILFDESDTRIVAQL